MRRSAEFESTVKGGLPVLVRARYFPPEPDIGIEDWQADIELCWLSGKPLSIPVPTSDYERIYFEALEERVV